MTLKELLKKRLQESMPTTKPAPSINPNQPITRPGTKPQKPGIRRPLTPGKDAPKPAPKAEGMQQVQMQREQIEQEVYSRIQDLSQEFQDTYGITEGDFNEMIVNSIRKNMSGGLREGDNAMLDKIAARYNKLKG